MNTTYDVDYFIAKFSAIPDERWDTKLERDGRHCVLGHCGYRQDWSIGATFNVVRTPEGDALREIFRDALNVESVPEVNDGLDKRYQQPTPRARILAALQDIKSKAEQAMEEYEDRPLVESSTQLVTK